MQKCRKQKSQKFAMPDTSLPIALDAMVRTSGMGSIIVFCIGGMIIFV